MNYTKVLLDRRYKRTLRFIEQVVNKESRILDLGTRNDFSEFLEKEGYNIDNTKGEDLDLDYSRYTDYQADVITAFEIFEHLLAPYNILRALKQPRLIASVPLKLWFAPAYWNEKDEWDRHYHEFEIKQFNFLLEKSGWKIIKSETWKSAHWMNLGIRPLLRHFYPRYYIVYCERIKQP
jgi:hypothetical protein